MLTTQNLNLLIRHSLVFRFVVKFLSVKEKVKCQLVCHQWKDIVDDEFRLYQFCLSSWSCEHPNQHQIYKPSPMTYIGSRIDKWIKYKNYKLDSILSRFPNLKCIYLDSVYNFNNRNIYNELFYYVFDNSMLKFFKSKCLKLKHIYLIKAKQISWDSYYDDVNGISDFGASDLIGLNVEYYVDVIDI